MLGNYLNVDVLLGKTLTKIDNDTTDELIFHTSDGEVFKMYHEQDCCESVEIEEIIGDLNDLLNTPLTMAEETTQEGESDWGSQTWTFYKFATIKGYVTIRWLGESNGYYSESVYFIKVEEEKPMNLTINELCIQAFETAKSKGWHDEPRETGTKLALIHSEVSEALEADRMGDQENFAEELADVVIRVLDLCGSMGINLEKAIAEKMEKNKDRSYKHGGKAY